MDLSHELKMNNVPILIPMKGISRRSLGKNRTLLPLTVRDLCKTSHIFNFYLYNLK